MVSSAYVTRALGVGSSSNIQNAKDKAAIAARRELASTMQTNVQRVINTYVETYEEDASSRFASITQEVAHITTNQMLVASTIVCEKITQTLDKKTKNIQYNAYVVVEVDNKDLLGNLHKQLEQTIVQDQQLHINLESFQTIFYDEMKKIAQWLLCYFFYYLILLFPRLRKQVFYQGIVLAKGDCGWT